VAGSPDADTRAAPLANFEIDITEQGWFDAEADSERYDLCSHGDIRLIIGGRVVAPGDGSGDWTISTSALALLRTLESDHVSGDWRDQLVLHCGMIFMLSCPLGIDWSVRHAYGRVHLSEVVLRDEARHDFPGLAADLTEEEYHRQLIAFAQKAKQPFIGVEKATSDDYEQQCYEEFWDEYDARLERAVARSTGRSA
jgi:hypothetical protein